jgi:ribosome-binding protein aMBF1 (putative translation factor)
VTDDDVSVLMCRPTSTLASPSSGSTREYCELCAEEVWASPGSIDYAGSHGRARVMFVCTECGEGLIAADSRAIVMPPSPRQLAELRERLARDPEGAS